MDSGLASVDIAIVGPGPVGTAAALASAQAGFTVALVGPANPRHDGRTVAVMDRSWQLLDQLGVASALEPEAAALNVMRLVDDTGSLFRRPPTEFRASEIGLDQFGFNVETATLAKALLAAAEADSRILRVPQAVKALEVSDGARLIRLADGATISARLVVGADGRKSVVRSEAGIGARDWSYPQSALTTIMRHSRAHRNVSTEFHTRRGPCTTVPLPGRRSSIVWMMAPDDAERLMAQDDAALALAIETRTHSILGHMSLDGPRGLTPMGGLSVERFSADRVALIGEAAHVFPPIGAQGLNLGMRDVMALRECLDQSDPGAATGLGAYDRNRSSDVRTRTGAVDALNRSLLSDMLPVDFARGFGLLALEQIGPLRRFVMRQGLNPSSAADPARAARPSPKT